VSDFRVAELMLLNRSLAADNTGAHHNIAAGYELS
jgi:hypothetical protein